MNTYKIEYGSKFTWARYIVNANSEKESRLAMVPEMIAHAQADMENMNTEGIATSDFACTIYSVELLASDVDAAAALDYVGGGLNG